MAEQDQQLVCLDCGTDFTFSRGEAEAFARRGLQPPKRCKNCRANRARNRPDAAPVRYPTGDPNEYRSPMQCDFPSAQPARAPRDLASNEAGRGKPRNRFARRMMYATVCSVCGATAHVPFDPGKGREVLCRGCYAVKRGVAPADPTEEPAS